MKNNSATMVQRAPKEYGINKGKVFSWIFIFLLADGIFLTLGNEVSFLPIFDALKSGYIVPAHVESFNAIANVVSQV